MAIVFIVDAYSIVSKASVRRISKINVAAFKTIYHFAWTSSKPPPMV